jgi:hypothetical protein
MIVYFGLDSSTMREKEEIVSQPADTSNAEVGSIIVQGFDSLLIFKS